VILKRERLRVGAPVADRQREKSLAIKSFAPFAVELEDAADTLNLLQFFRGRHTTQDVEWDRDVVPRVRAFLTERIQPDQTYVLHLDTHLSLTYLAGTIVGKIAENVFPAYRGRTWRTDGMPETTDWVVGDEDIGAGSELAIAIEVSRAIAGDVRSYIRAALPQVGRLLTLRIPSGPSDRSVRDGDHALALARGVAATLRRLRTDDERRSPLHLFMAAPAPFVFFLGREGRVFGPTTTYEYDLEQGAPTGYTPALHVHTGTYGGT